MVRVAKKKELLRQDRYKVNNPKCFLLIRNEKYRVKDFSQYGITAVTEVEAHFVSDYGEIPLYLGRKILCVLDLAKLRQKKVENGFQVTFKVVGEPINAELIETVLVTHELIHKHLAEYAPPTGGMPDDYEVQDMVPVRFKRIIFMLLDWICALGRKLRTLETLHPHLSRRDLEECERAAVEEVVSFLDKSFRPVFAAMAKHLGSNQIKDYQAAFLFLREKMLEIVDLGNPENLRDFWIDKISAPISGNTTAGTDTESKDFFSRCLRRYFVNDSLQQIEKERENYLLDSLSGLYFQAKIREVGIMGFGSGFGHQIDRILHDHSEYRDADYSMHILASDLNALKKVQKKLLHTKAKMDLTSDFSFTCTSMESIISTGLDPEFGKYDFAFAFGVLDYLTDADFEAVIKRLHESLAPNGNLVVSGTSVSNPLIFRMSLVLDRHLIYRTDEDFGKLFERMALPYEMISSSESPARFFILK